ncbi:MAG: GTPase, partial [Planctomycetota bacterium]
MPPRPTIPDTIVAVSSPPGRSARGLIRLSGPETDEALAAVLDDVPGEVRRLQRVLLRRPAIPGLLARFAGPQSYTGEDAAELQLPGNAALLDRALHDIMDSTPGVRLAEPGEFTFRAYTAGKLDLTQAEGIAATISATSDSQLRAASLLREGRLGGVAASMVERLGNALALVEAGIDFTDQEDVVPIPPGRLLAHIEALHAELDGLFKRSRSWGAIQAPPRVVLVGPPSAGKSTLFNALLGHERAVIDASPGTTRDVLVEPLRLEIATGQAEVMLVDIAGLDDALSPSATLPDRHAQEAARDAIRSADLILQVRETDAHSPTEQLASHASALQVQTKSDITPSDRFREQPPGDHPAAIQISARTGQGLDDLKAAIARQIGDLAVSITGDMLALQPRHESALQQAHQQLA